jgi:cytochrome d ubiquinol oxidase subunit II
MIGLPELIAAIIIVALNAYVLLGGADYGGGLWDLLASGPRREAQRTLIADSIAPIWEANHVWLIVVVVMLFTAFPAAFATLGIVLHVPLTLLLIGIVLRGSAFMFRSYGPQHRAHRRRWGLAFAIASSVTPVLLGIVIGAVASGAVGDAAARVGGGAAVRPSSFMEVFVAPWLAPFPIAVGCFALALFAFLAAVYLAVAAPDPPLRDDFRRRALASAVAVFVLAAVAMVSARSSAPVVARGVAGSLRSILLHIATGLAAVTAIGAIWRRQYGLARFAAAAQVTLILWGWAVAQYPYVIPTTLTIRDAAAPPITLALLVVGLTTGAVILIPSLRYLFKLFVRKPAATTQLGP